jgi:Mrp family chromosome partitioning ATPase
LGNYLSGELKDIKDIINKTTYPNLYVLPAGSFSANPTELLLRGDLERLFKYLEAVFDFVILDTCPVGPVIDAFSLSEYCDASLFVIRHDFSTRAMIESLKKSHRLSSLKNVKIVFNGIKRRGFLGNGYGYGYGYGSNRLYKETVYQLRPLATKN